MSDPFEDALRKHGSMKLLLLLLAPLSRALDPGQLRTKLWSKQEQEVREAEGGPSGGF